MLRLAQTGSGAGVAFLYSLYLGSLECILITFYSIRASAACSGVGCDVWCSVGVDSHFAKEEG